MMKRHSKNLQSVLFFSEKRFIFWGKKAETETQKDASQGLEKKTKAEALKEVKTESDKRVLVVKQKLDKIGGRFTGDLYDRLYEYYQSALDRAAKDGTLDKKGFETFKKEVLDRTDEILKKYTPTEADEQAAKEGNAAAKEIAKLKESSEEKIKEIPKELPEDTPVEQLNDKMQEYSVLNSSLQIEVQKRMGEMHDFYDSLQKYQDSKKGFTNRASLTWDKLTGVLPGVECNDDNKVKKLQGELDDLKDSMEKKRRSYKKKKEEIEKFGKSISRVLAKRRIKLLGDRDAEVKKLEGEKGAKEETLKANEKRYKELKEYQHKLVDQHDALAKKKEGLETLRNADDSPANVSKKLETKKMAVAKVSDAESEKEKALEELLKEPNLTDDQRQALTTALEEVKARKQKAEAGKTFLDKSADKAKGVDTALTEQENAVAGDLGTVGDTIDKVVDPSLISLEEQILVLETQKKKYGECIEGVKDKYDYHIGNLDKIQKEADNHILDASLGNSLAIATFSSACDQLDKVKVETEGVFGVIWNDAKYMYQDSVGKIASVPGEWLHKFGKFVAEQGNVITQGSYQYEEWYKKWPAATGANIVSFFTGATGGMFELGGGLLTVAGKPFDTVEGIGALVTVNAKEGTVGDTELAGKSWKALGKALISYDDFAEGNVGTGVGKIFTNIASLFIGGGADKAGQAASIAAKAEALAAAGGKTGFFARAGVKAAEVGAYFKAFGTEVVKKPGALKVAGEVAEAAEIGNAATKASAGLKAMSEAGDVATQIGKGAEMLQGFERAEKAAHAASKLKAERAIELAKRAEAAETAAKVSGSAKKLEEAAKIRSLADDAAKAAKQAEEVLQLSKRAKDAAKAADDALKELQEISKTKGPTSSEAVAATAKYEQLIGEAKLVAGAAETAALAVGGGGKLVSVFKYFGEKAVEKLPGGAQAADRFALAEGGGAKALAVARGAAEVTLKTAWEGVKLGAKGAKFVMMDLPIGLLKYSGRIIKSIPQLTKLALQQGIPGAALRFERVRRALSVMEHEAKNLDTLNALWREKVLSQEAVVGDIFKGMKTDPNLAKIMKDVDLDKMAKLVREDPTLMKLFEENPQIHKVFESRALMKFLEFEKNSAQSLLRIQEAAETVFQWSARDEQVAKILDKIFEKGLYPKASKAAKAEEAADAAKTETAAPGAAAEGKAGEQLDLFTAEGQPAYVPKSVEQPPKVFTETLRDEYVKLYMTAEKNPYAANFILRDVEKNVIQAFEKQIATDAVTDASQVAKIVETEFGKTKFVADRTLGEIKVGDKVFELRANEKGKLQLFEQGKNSPVAPPAAPAPAPKPMEQLDLFTEKQLQVTAEEAALEAEMEFVQETTKALQTGKIPKRYPVKMDDVMLGDQYFASVDVKKRGVIEDIMDKRISDAVANSGGKISIELPADMIQRGYLSALRRKAAGQGLEIGEFTLVEKTTAKGVRYSVEAPIGKPVPKVAAAAPETAIVPESVIKITAETPLSLQAGKYIGSKIRAARDLYKSWKVAPSESTKLSLDKILKDNGVFTTRIMGRGFFPEKGTIEERIAALEYAVIKIESLQEFPPDVTLPQDFLDWQKEQMESPTPGGYGSEQPVQKMEVVEGGIESSPADEQKMKDHLDKVLSPWRAKEPQEMTVEALTAALNIEFSTFEKKAQGNVQTSRDSVRVTIGKNGKKVFEGLAEWIEDVPLKRAVGVAFKEAFDHGMKPDYFVEKNKGQKPKSAKELQALMQNDIKERVEHIAQGLSLKRELKVYSKSGSFSTNITPEKAVSVEVTDRFAEETFSRMMSGVDTPNS